MAILNSAMQALLDNLHDTMSDVDPQKRLSVEDQTLVVTAIKQLSALTNWDAARLAMMIKPGTPAVFQE